MKAILLAFVLAAASAYAQDMGAWAAQQASEQAAQAAQQANQQAMQAAQQASQQAMQNTQTAMQMSGPVIAVTLPPSFSVQAGDVEPETSVRITCRVHYATIYYTTNGWTPTLNSRRYTGPITIKATTRLQAIAVAPNMFRSAVASVKYTVKGTAAPMQTLTLSPDAVLHAGTRLRLITASTVNSKTAHVGDALTLLLDQDVKAGGMVVIPKGSPAEAIITQADPSGAAGTPGDLSFEVHSVVARGSHIGLTGGETLEGANRYKTRGFLLVPVVGLASLAIHGQEAEIKPGMTLTAAVAADAPLQP
jgi:hypothetical protein